MARRGSARKRLKADNTAVVKLPKRLSDLIRVRQSVDDPLRDFVLRTVGGKQALYALLQQSTHDNDASKIVEEWDRLSPTDKTKSDLGPVMDACDMTTREFVGIVARCAWDLNVDIGKAIFAMRYPAIMDASTKRAVKGDNVERERMHFVAAGHVPGPRGIQIGIVNTNRQGDDTDEPKPGQLRSFRATARSVVRDIPATRTLPPSGE